MTYAVILSPKARDQLMALDAYIAAEAASPDIAGRYTDAILAYCHSLATFPSAAHVATTFGQACASRTTASVP